MAQTKTAKEAQTEYVKHMGTPLGEQFSALWQEVAWLYLKWGEYDELFGKKPSRIQLLNNAAPLFFRVVENVLWEDTLLHIARLTDPAQSPGKGKKTNLTIKALPDLVDAGIKKSIAGFVDVSVQRAEFCRDWRNRHIAHRDLALALDGSVNPLKPANRKKVRGALEAIVDVLNAISQHYIKSQTKFDYLGVSTGAVSLLYVIDDGLKVEAERLDRMRRREVRPEDIEARDL